VQQAFLDYGYTAKQLPLLNLCRLWSRVTTLADIATGDGRNIQRKFWDQQERTTHQADKWPQQGTPDTHCWALWRKALSQCFLRPDGPHRRLRTTLDAWIIRPDCEWYYSTATDTVFEAQNATWIQRERNTGHQPSRFQGFRRTNTVLDQLPPYALPTMVYGNDIVRIQGTAPIRLPEQDNNKPQWWNEIVHIPTDLTPLLDGIHNGTAICVTNGSYKHTYGSAALIILPFIDAPKGIILVHQTPGIHEGMDPYRAELGGIYGCIAYVQTLTKAHDIGTGAITLACDCWSAILNIFMHERDNPNQPQYDRVHSCRLLLQASTVTWNSRHGAGHQDDHVAFNELDQWGQLNVDMDLLAKRHRVHIETEFRPTFGLPSLLDWSLWRGREYHITTWSEDTAALTLLYSLPARTFWKKKLRTTDTAPEPHWDSTQLAFKQNAIGKRIWQIKYLHNRLPI
jgi:hypothetical protein